MKKSKKSKSKNFCLFFFPRVVESSSFIISTLWLVSFITDARARLREREREREGAEKKEAALREESVVHQLEGRERESRVIVYNREENKKRERERRRSSYFELYPPRSW